jgi:hypothetical protein
MADEDLDAEIVLVAVMHGSRVQPPPLRCFGGSGISMN